MITRELTWEDSQLILCIPWKFRNATDSETDSLSTHTFWIPPSAAAERSSLYIYIYTSLLAQAWDMTSQAKTKLSSISRELRSAAALGGIQNGWLLKKSGTESVAFLKLPRYAQSQLWVLPGQVPGDHFSQKHVKGDDFYSDVCLNVLATFCKKHRF